LLPYELLPLGINACCSCHLDSDNSKSSASLRRNIEGLEFREDLSDLNSISIRTREFAGGAPLPRNNYPLAKKFVWILLAYSRAVSPKTQIKQHLLGFGEVFALKK